MNSINDKLVVSQPSFEDISSIIANLKKHARDGDYDRGSSSSGRDKELELMPIAISPETTKFLILYNITSGNPDLINHKNFDLVERIMQSPALSRAFNSDGKYVQFYDANANTTDEDQYMQMMNGMYIYYLRYYTFLYESRISENDMSASEKKLRRYLIDVSRLSTNEKLLGKEVIVRGMSSTMTGLAIAFTTIFSVFATQYVLQNWSTYLGSKTTQATGAAAGNMIKTFVSAVGPQGIGYILAGVGLVGTGTALSIAAGVGYYNLS
jgi:hypothetical protein